MTLALIALLAASSGSVDCKALDERANTAGARIPGDEAVYEVIGTGRAPFYSAPDLACPKPGVFMIPKDQVTAYVDYGNFTAVMFINLKTGQTLPAGCRPHGFAPPARESFRRKW